MCRAVKCGQLRVYFVDLIALSRRLPGNTSVTICTPIGSQE